MSYTERYLKGHLNCNRSVEVLFKEADSKIKELEKLEEKIKLYDDCSIMFNDAFRELKDILSELNILDVEEVRDLIEIMTMNS